MTYLDNGLVMSRLWQTTLQLPSLQEPGHVLLDEQERVHDNTTQFLVLSLPNEVDLREDVFFPILGHNLKSWQVYQLLEGTLNSPAIIEAIDIVPSMDLDTSTAFSQTQLPWCKARCCG